MRKLFCIGAMFLTGCASTPVDLVDVTTGALCVGYAKAILNPNRDAWLAEVYRRGQTCAPYAAEMAAASSASQSSLNSLNQRYMPAVQPAVSSGITAFYVRESIVGASKMCSYNALGNPHVITVRAVDMCPRTVSVSR
jgi:hypothetical protein